MDYVRRRRWAGIAGIYGTTVREEKLKANADFMAEKLAAYGWSYVMS